MKPHSVASCGPLIVALAAALGLTPTLRADDARPKTDTSLPMRVNNPRKLAAWQLPAERIALGEGYKPSLARLPGGELVLVALFHVRQSLPGPGRRAAPAAGGGEGLATQLLGKLVNRLEADGETIRESQKLAAGHHRLTRWAWALGAAVLLGVLVLALVVVLTRPPGSVTVQLALGREMKDPTIAVLILDGKERTKEELSAPVTLVVGDHVLEIKRKDGSVATRRFTVGRQDDQKEVALGPKKTEPAPEPTGIKPRPEPRPEDRGPAPGEWGSLFNGKDLDGWTIYPEDTTGWEVKDGVIVSAGPVSQLFGKHSGYKNFHFRVEAMINDRGRSAQCFRAKFGQGTPVGYRAAINSTSREYGNLSEPGLAHHADQGIVLGPFDVDVSPGEVVQRCSQSIQPVAVQVVRGDQGIDIVQDLVGLGFHIADVPGL
jgi:hypothetical protein